MNIVLASHKTFLDKVLQNNATACVFVYSNKEQLKLVRRLKMPCHTVLIDNVHPGRNKGKPLPSVDNLLSVVKFFCTLSNSDRVVIADPRGKGIALALAMVCDWMKGRAARQTVVELNLLYPKATVNGFVLRLVDALIDSRLAHAAQSFGNVKYIKFDLDSYEPEPVEEKVEDPPKPKEQSKQEEPKAEVKAEAKDEPKVRRRRRRRAVKKEVESEQNNG